MAVCVERGCTSDVPGELGRRPNCFIHYIEGWRKKSNFPFFPHFLAYRSDGPYVQLGAAVLRFLHSLAGSRLVRHKQSLLFFQKMEGSLLAACYVSRKMDGLAVNLRMSRDGGGIRSGWKSFFGPEKIELIRLRNVSINRLVIENGG